MPKPPVSLKLPFSLSLCLLAALLTACASQPAPGSESQISADYDCRMVAYQNSGDAAKAFIPVVGAWMILTQDSPDKLRQTPDYATCMAKAGVPVVAPDHAIGGWFQPSAIGIR